MVGLSVQLEAETQFMARLLGNTSHISVPIRSLSSTPVGNQLENPHP